MEGLLLLVTCSFAQGMERRGGLSDTAMAALEDLLNEVTGERPLTSLHIPPAPQSDHQHRDVTLLCRLADTYFCPGEVLFRNGM